MKKLKIWQKNVLMLIVIIVLMVSALLVQPNGSFGGSDGAAETMITKLDPSYKPWISALLKPKSGEIESLLFTLQGSLGVGIIAYIIGYFRGKKKNAIN